MDNTAITQLNTSIQQLITKMSLNNKSNSSFAKYNVDLTSAHTLLKITNQRPFDYIQVFCDGALDGIEIRLGDQSSEPLPLNQMVIIPVTSNPDFLWLSNDVRSGRSLLTIYWVRSEPLTLNRGGQDISLAEQAVRNGSIVSFDRRGEVVWFDDFENGLQHWDITTSGKNGNICLTSETASRGAVALKFTAGSDVDHYAQVSRGVAFPRFANAMGVETSWAIGGDIDEAHLLFDLYTGVVSFHYGVRTIVATGETDILTGVNTWTQVNAGPLSPPYANIRHFVQFKFVVDLPTMAYKRFLFASVDNPVSGYKGYMIPDFTIAHAQLTGKIIGTAGKNGVAYNDNFIITQNEP